MKAITLMRHGIPQVALKLMDMPKPKPDLNEVLINVEAFGLNYSDISARIGMNPEAPPMPCILGYEVVGIVEEIGNEVNVRNLEVGDRVLGLTRFGGYAEFAVANGWTIAKIDEDMDSGVAVALCTQYSTAIHAAYGMANIYEGDHVLIHAAAGGVGSALVQLAKRRRCIIYGTAGSSKKIEHLEKEGVHYPIHYRKKNFQKEINAIRPEGIDVIFDPIGGSSFKKDMKILASGGRIICYGVFEREKTGLYHGLKFALKFGFLHPIKLLLKSQGVVGVNMMRIADEKPHIIQKSLRNVVRLYKKGELNPHVGARFKASEITKAHEFLEERKSIGKVVIEWD